MIRRLFCLGLAGVGCLFAGYNYDSRMGTSSSVWQINGSVQTGTTYPGWYSFPAGSSAMYTAAVTGTNPNDYELESTLWPSASGSNITYIHFLRANSSSVTNGAGSYISVELVLPSNNSGGGAVQMNVKQCVNGAVTTFASTSVTIYDWSVFRTIVWGTNLRVFVNGQDVADVTIPQTTGMPGIGAGGAGSGGAAFASTWVGHHDTIAPNAIASEPVASNVLPNSVSLNWPATTDDGIGMFRYQIYRNSSFLSYAYATEIADSSGPQPNTAYMYQIIPEDQHGNVGTALTLNITTPPAQNVDPRRTGLTKNGSYWGGGGEQIDTLSGNLNFSIPLLTTLQRTGQKFPLGLNYNSQNWEQDSGFNWQLSSDVGYGFGWKLQFGSLAPYYKDGWSGVDHYVFTDGTGATYVLNVNNNNVWSSSQSIYVWFDANANRLHFNDGSFWAMGCTSGGNEPDAGTMYPTTLEDVNGNQIMITYSWATSLGEYDEYGSINYNTSARIASIQDFRGSYTFGYVTNQNSQNCPSQQSPQCPPPHLASVGNSIGTAENYTLLYLNNSPLGPPFGSDPRYSGATTTFLSNVIVPISSNSYSFTYDSSGAGELQQVTFPYGGHLGWNYVTFQYTAGRSLREVGTRYLTADSAGANTWTYTISRNDSSNPNPVVHANMTLVDASGVGAKTWNFSTTNSGVAAWQVGLLSSFVQQSASGGYVYQGDTFTWAQDATSNPYISSKSSVIDPSGSNPQTALSSQTLDQYGNATQSVVYPYNNTSTPLQTYNNTYIYSQSGTGQNYAANYVMNRLLSTVLTLNGGVNKTLVTNGYDAGGNVSLAVSGASLDPNAPVPLAYRGLLSSSTTPAGGTWNFNYDNGNAATVTRSDGTHTSYIPDSTTNYSAPTTISTESYSQSVSYNAWLGITQTTGANGEQLRMTYDHATGRPVTGTSAYGAVTTYTYSPSTCAPPSCALWQQESGPNGITITTLDGLGRAIRVAREDSNGVVQSYTDTVYAPCACSPLGKVQMVSLPYAPFPTPSNPNPAPPAWTVYTYDGLGRTVSVQQPDGASTTTYSYSGNQTTVKDPAGNSKTFTKDVLGNLTTVVEPDPANQPGGTLATSYTYDWMNHVSQVSMARAGTTQNRYFVYSDAGLLTSATNPENGTVNYFYNGTNTLQYKQDAKGQATVYTYDYSNRVTMIQKYPHGQANAEDTCQRVAYTYGTDPSNFSYSRLASVSYETCVPNATPIGFLEQYSYNSPGGVISKQLAEGSPPGNVPPPYNSSIIPANYAVNVGYTYDAAGRTKAISYPVTAIDPGWNYWNPNASYTLTYGFDSMGRPNSLTDNYATSNSSTTTWVQNLQYDYAGRMSSMQYLTRLSDNSYGTVSDTYTTESMSYNTNGQLASLNFSGGVTGGVQYSYPATQNNGQIAQAVDTISGETIVYQYDALKRLNSASSTPNTGSGVAAWSQAFQYDGFGNLVSKTLNGGSNLVPAVNAATNQLSSASYDLNGNMTSGAGATLAYDVSNRLVSAQEVSGGIEYYGYAPDNKQVYRQLPNGNQEFTLYGARGEKLGVYAPGYNGLTGLFALLPLRTNIYFAGKMIWSDNTPAYQDRLGTNRANGARFMPFGDEITSTTNDREKFATYTRDSYTGLDYADQRFYASTYGRFNTPDPYIAGGAAKGSVNNPGDPGSWNRYQYTGGDPVNRSDPKGTDWVWTGQGWCSTLDYYGGCYDPEGGDSNNCYQMAAMAWMNYGGYQQMCGNYAPIIPVAAPAPPSLTFSVSLYERPVYVDRTIPGIGSVPIYVGEHTYIDATAQLSTGAYVNFLCQGGPSGPNGTGNLVGSCQSGYNTMVSVPPSGPGLSANIQVGGTYSCGNCGAVVQLLASAALYMQSGNLAPYSGTMNGGYNSNSYAFTLLEDIGLAGYTSTGSAWSSFGTPWLAPGWGVTVPGLGP